MMEHKILVDPLVVLNPLSFAFHLAVFSECDEPIAVPLGWLWEEIDRRYAMLEIADIMVYYSGSGSACLDEHIYNPYYSFPAAVALLAIANRYGLIRPVATKATGMFLRHKSAANWSSYLAGLLGDDWSEIELESSVCQKADEVAASTVAAEFNISPSEVIATFKRNLDWEKRRAEEYPVYERFRALRVELSQLYACLEAGYDVSTPSNHIRKLATDTLKQHNIVTTIGSRNPLLPILRKVTFDPRPFTVGDVLEMVEHRDLLKKVGAADLTLDETRLAEERKGFGKDLILYLLGLIPAMGTVASILGAIDLLNDARELLSTADEGESILYCDMTGIQVREHRKKQ